MPGHGAGPANLDALPDGEGVAGDREDVDALRDVNGINQGARGDVDDVAAAAEGDQLGIVGVTGAVFVGGANRVEAGAGERVVTLAANDDARRFDGDDAFGVEVPATGLEEERAAEAVHQGFGGNVIDRGLDAVGLVAGLRRQGDDDWDLVAARLVGQRGVAVIVADGGKVGDAVPGGSRLIRDGLISSN